MKSFFFICLTNCLDFGILEKYLKCFSQERKVDRYKLIFLFLFCTITTSIVNMYKNPTINLLCSICMIYLYSLSFSYSRLYYIILPILYIGLGFVSEPIGFLLTLRLETQISMEISFYISALICEFIRYLLVRAICHSWAIQLPNLSKQMSLLLFLIPLSSVFISCMAIYLTGTYDNLTGNVLCLAIILLVLLTNILTFAIFHKLSIVIADNYKNELLLQEVNMKEQYYREIEAGNKKVQEIKHDLKNRLIAFYAIEKANVDFKKEFQKIIGELDEGEKTIYTANIIVNTILNNKLRNAQKRHIATEASVLVPKQMNLGYSAAGILLGNLLDNAIEACEKIEVSKRWITVNIIYKEHTLILKICNSKEIKKANIALSSKRHYKQSGIGIHSVTRVVEKYNGTIEFWDLDDSFEVSAILYGILSAEISCS